jgi:hypothetical protein
MNSNAIAAKQVQRAVDELNDLNEDVADSAECALAPTLPGRRTPPRQPSPESSFMNRPFALVVGLLLTAAPTQAAPIYADTLVSTTPPTTPFGSGLVTGAPDGGGIFLGVPPSLTPTSSITVGFNSPIGNGPGADLRIIDIESFSADPTETADVFVSTDGTTFFFVGSITGGNAAGSIDLQGVFNDPVNFVRITTTSTIDALDIDAIQANYAFNAIPEPATLAVFGALALGAFGVRRRLRASA